MTNYDKGKPAERQGRKATGLRLHDNATRIAGLPTGSEAVCRVADCFSVKNVSTFFIDLHVTAYGQQNGHEPFCRFQDFMEVMVVFFCREGLFG